MTTKRFQIFVSSTFSDLVEERKIVQEAIFRLEHFPAGMEAFPATDDDAWGLIKQVITDSDYYLLIVGGRYGSCDANGTSYTEKEYEFALEKNIPVIAFVHANLTSLQHGKVEADLEGRLKLNAFTERVKSKHHVRFWNNPLELQGAIYPAIQQLIRTKPALGWTRQQSGPSVDELNRRLVEIQSKFDECKAELDAFKNRPVSLEAVLCGSIKIDYQINYNGEVSELSESKSIVLNWAEVFWKLCREFEKGLIYTQFMYRVLLPRIPEESKGTIRILNDGQKKIIAHLFNVGVINSSPAIGNRASLVWTLTELGKKIYYSNIASADSTSPDSIS